MRCCYPVIALLINCRKDWKTQNSTRASGSTEDWTPLATSGTPPHVRYSHAAMYDSNHDRMIVFGGYTAGLLFSDVWALNFTTDPPSWTQIATTAGPSGRSNHAAVYNRQTNHMIVFGGVKPELTKETWWLDFNTSPATWTRTCRWARR